MQPNQERKSLGAEDTFAIDVFELEAARAKIGPLVEKVWRHCEAKALHGRTVTLKVKYADFQQITRSRTMSRALGTAADVQELAGSLLDPLFPTERGIRLIGVTLSSFGEDQRSPPGQLSLRI